MLLFKWFYSLDLALESRGHLYQIKLFLTDFFSSTESEIGLLSILLVAVVM